MLRLIFSGAMLGGAAYLFWVASQLRAGVASYPMLVTGGAIAFLLIHALRLVWLHRTAPSEAGEGTALLPSPDTLPRLAGFAVVWGGYVVALPKLGFILTTWIALTLSLALVARLRLLSPLWTALFVAVLALLMKVVLYVPVPQGFLDVQLDELLYRLR